MNWEKEIYRSLRMPIFIFGIFCFSFLSLQEKSSAEDTLNNPSDYTSKALSPGTFNLNADLSSILFDNKDHLSFGLGLGIMATSNFLIQGQYNYTKVSNINIPSVFKGDFYRFYFGISFLKALGKEWYLDVGGQAGKESFSSHCEEDCRTSTAFNLGAHFGTGVFLSPRLSLVFQPFYERTFGEYSDTDSFGMNIKIMYFFTHRKSYSIGA